MHRTTTIALALAAALLSGCATPASSNPNPLPYCDLRADAPDLEDCVAAPASRSAERVARINYLLAEIDRVTYVDPLQDVSVGDTKQR